MIKERTLFLKQFWFIGVIIILVGSINIFIQSESLEAFFSLETLVPFSILLFVGMSIFLVFGTFTFNPNDKKLEKYISFLFFKFASESIILPKTIDYVKVVKSYYNVTRHIRGVLPYTHKKTTYDVYLIYDTQSKKTKLFSVAKKIAIAIGQKFATSYNVPLIDKTQ